MTRDEVSFIFDLDGTLVDSVYQHVLAWQEALHSEHIDLSMWRVHRRMGMSGGPFTAVLLREIDAEHLVSLRAMPGLTVLRPADANEVIEAYRYILRLRHRPVVLALSRQPLPTLDRSRYGAASGTANGAYVLADADGPLQLILIATGSEVSPAIQAYETLRSEGVRCRVVSMPSWDLFEQQSTAYRESVLPSSVTARLAIEQGSTLGWERYVGPQGRVIGMHTFGGSAPLKALLSKFGFDPASILTVAREMLSS